MVYNLERLNVLALDDSPHMLNLLKGMLLAMEIKNVRTVTSAAAALQELRQWGPDLVISDYRMEPINGLEFIRQVRQDKASNMRFVPIILLTGLAELRVVKAARFQAGADAVLAKPVSVETLYNCITSFFKHPRTFVETRNYFGPDRRIKARPFEGLDRREAGDNDEQAETTSATIVSTGTNRA